MQKLVQLVSMSSSIRMPQWDCSCGSGEGTERGMFVKSRISLEIS